MRFFYSSPFFAYWGANSIMGTDRADYLFGRWGADTIDAGAGNDLVFGGWGNDSILAGAGHDWVFGGWGHDYIDLGSGNDVAYGGWGDDTIATGAGNDRVYGGWGQDTVILSGTFESYDLRNYNSWFRSYSVLRLLDEDGNTVETKRLSGIEILQFDDLTVYLDGRNNAVVARDDQAAASEEGVALIAVADLLANDLDADGDALTVTSVSNSAAGAVVSLADGQISYDPGALFDGLAEGETASDSFTYTVTDGRGSSTTATVTVTVTGVNDAPEMSGPATASIEENATGVVAQVSAMDVDGDAISFTLSGADAALFSISDSGALSLSAALDFEAPADANGDNVYDVTVVASDASGASDTLDITVSVTDVAEAKLVFSEIMYNPASGEPAWEWVEITNTGTAEADLAGWVFDDINGAAQSAANIAAGTIAAGASAILYNADAISAEDFAAAWGEGINLIAVTGWSNASLNNSGDTIGLWSSFAAYEGDHQTHANAVISLTYDDANGWPADNNAASIYLTDLSADMTDGANWALSTDGGETPVNTGETAQAAGGNSGADIASPGGIIPVGNVKITEFRPNPNGSDPATTQVELSGNPGAVFEGYIVAIEGDSSGAGSINNWAAVSGTFDANGLLSVTVDDFENPSFTLVVTDRFDEANAGSIDIDTDDDGTVDETSAFGTIYDAIGTPDAVGDETTVYGAELGGEDFAYTGDEPQLIFRDGDSGALYAVNDPAGDTVFTTDGTELAQANFSADPTQATFGAENPIYQAVTPPAPLSLVINEVLADPASGLAGDANGDGTRSSSQDEFVEIVNTGSAEADLSGVTLSDANGVRHTFADGTTLAAGAAIVVFGGGSPTGDFGGAQVVTASGGFLSLNNGGDTVTLAQADGTQLDQVVYGGEGGSDESLTRAPDLTGDFAQHETVSDASYSPGTQADGTAFGGTTGARSISINELRHNQPGADSDEFIELFSENAATSLDGLSLVVLSGEFAPGKVDAVFDLSAGSFDSDGVFMLTTTALTTGTVDSGDIVLDQADLRLFGSPSTYLLVEGFTGAVDDDLDSNDDGTLDVTPWGNVLDSVSFVDGDSTADQSYSETVVGPDGTFTWAGIAADPDGSDSYTQLAFGDTSSDTPGARNGGGVVTPPTGDTLISQVQGAGSASGMVGQTVTLTAIVVGDFQNGDGDANRNLGGFFLQEEAADHDSNAATSEGIFVYEGTGNLITDVALGDKVTITGTVSEYFGSTQVTATSVSIVEAGAVADVNTMAATVDLDGAGAVSDGNGGYVADLEAYEGMLINIPETLTVSEAFQMDRFGEIRLSAGGRPVQFTQENDPDAAGYAQHLQDVASDSIVYDDGKTIQNPTPFSEADLDGNGVVNTADGFGMGDTVTGATGVLGYSFNEFRMHSVAEGANTFVDTETREATPTSLDREADGAAPDLVVSSFNVLNFFTTLDNGGARSGPNNLEPRGAETAAEYERQLEKLLTTLDLMNADIIGLVELENEFQSDQNGDGLVPIEEIVKGMNAIDGAGIWAYVDPGRSYVDTGDAISVGMIYRTDKVTLSGPAQILDDSVVATLSGDYGSDGLFDGQSTNRAPLAANFTYDYSDLGGNPISETFTVAVTHMKSKGGTGSGGNADQGDGAGNYNETRTEGVQALIEWLDADRAGGFADADQVVLGDFNAYAKEDPIDTMLAANYKNLEEEFEPGSTTFVFDGQTGTLDYAFASGDMMAHVTNAGAWNINSAEPDLYDYNLNTDRDLSTNERDPAIFDGDVPFRTSDHDPLLLGLNFTDELLFA